MAIKYLNITVTNKKATFLTRQGDIVCGNSDYRVRFAFDSEWDGHDAKVARFIWGGHFTDVEFSGNEVDVPVISGATEVKVGVYTEGDGPHTTTSATIPATPSVLCEGGTASLENDKRYLNEAREVLRQCQEVEVEAANAVRASAIGAPVTLTDISPLSHELRVRLKSRNLLNYGPDVTSKTINGVTFTNNNDGTITVNGTATLNANYYIATGKLFFTAGAYNIYPFASATHAQVVLHVEAYKGGTWLSGTSLPASPAEGRKFRITEDADRISVLLQVKAGATVSNLIVRPLVSIQQSIEFTPYTTDFTGAKVKRYGATESDLLEEYTASADGTVAASISSLYPVTTLATEPYAAVEVEYHQDMQKALDGYVKKVPIEAGGGQFIYLAQPSGKTATIQLQYGAPLAWTVPGRLEGGVIIVGNPTSGLHAANLDSIALYRHDLVFKGGLDYNGTTGVVRCTTYNADSTPSDYSENHAVDSSAHAASGIITIEGTTYTVVGVAAGTRGNSYDIYYAKPDGTVGIFHFYDGLGDVTDTITKIK